MNNKELKTNEEEPVVEMLDKQYLESSNKKELDYWAPLSKIILESVELRDSKGLSQTDLASLMKTKQSVISRFENMGRIPSYDFIARLAIALNHSPGMTLYGDFMAIVPAEKQKIIKEIANEEKTTTNRVVQNILDTGIDFVLGSYGNKYENITNANLDYNEFESSNIIKYPKEIISATTSLDEKESLSVAL